MELAVISPEDERADEGAVVGELLEAGVTRYHVRKPGWGAAQMEAWLLAMPQKARERMVLHSHHELALKHGLLGRHWRDDGEAPLRPDRGRGFTSRSCHDLAALRAAAGGYDAIFFGPVFGSESKPGREAVDNLELEEVSRWLRGRTEHERKTRILALSGVTPERVARCRQLGFDGVAVMGGVWSPKATRGGARPPGALDEPMAPYSPGGRPARPEVALHLQAFFAYRKACRPILPPILCLTQDGLPLSHAEQARLLCAAGAQWIQLRAKGAADSAWLQLAREVTAICHAHGALCVVNDRVDLALAAGADGVHLGKNDGDWREARRALGPAKVLGGTVNDEADARRAAEAGCLDYVGVGPLRFTATKQKLAPVLGIEGIRRVIENLDGLPAWTIGGVEAEDFPDVRAAGAAGVAVSSALYRGGAVAMNFRALALAWPGAALLEPSARQARRGLSGVGLAETERRAPPDRFVSAFGFDRIQL